MKDPKINKISEGDAQRILPLSLNSVTAIVVSYHSGEILKKCLNSLLEQDEINEIILVDNGNPQSVRAWLVDLEKAHNQIKLITPGHNTGFAAGCNLGAAKATGDYLAFVNPDCVIPEETIEKILQVFSKHPGAWLCGGRLSNPDGSEQRGGRRDILTPWTALVELTRIYRLFPKHPYFRRFHLYEQEPITSVQEMPTVSGAFMVIGRRHYKKVGGMDENLFLHFDDSDLCIRIMEHGGKVLYCGHIPIIHYQGSSDVSRIFIQWHKTRSTNIYFYKHFMNSYPSWFLLCGMSVLWIRFILLVPILAIGDIPGIIRRLKKND